MEMIIMLVKTKQGCHSLLEEEEQEEEEDSTVDRWIIVDGVIQEGCQYPLPGYLQIWKRLCWFRPDEVVDCLLKR